MSLDVYLKLPGAEKLKESDGSGIFIREDGQTKEISREQWDEMFPGREPAVVLRRDDSECYTYQDNITHNLGPMAREAGIYVPLWQPEEIGITHAGQLIEPLRDGLAELQSNPSHYEMFNPDNGWGDYKGFCLFVAEYLSACIRYPEAIVSVWR